MKERKSKFPYPRSDEERRPTTYENVTWYPATSDFNATEIAKLRKLSQTEYFQNRFPNHIVYVAKRSVIIVSVNLRSNPDAADGVLPYLKTRTEMGLTLWQCAEITSKKPQPNPEEK